MEYTYEKLSGIYDEALKKFRAKTDTPRESVLGMAAAYAIDFIDAGKSIGAELDITAQTEENITKTMAAVYYADLKAGKNKHDCKTLLTKKFAYYQLFSIVNSMNIEKETVKIDFAVTGPSVLPKLIISSLPGENGEVYTFDVLDAAERTIDKLRFNKPSGDGALFTGTLAPFYQKLKEDMMDHLVET